MRTRFRKWLGPKMLALLVAVLVVAAVFTVQASEQVSDAASFFLLTFLMGFGLGWMPALLVTALSDLLALRWTGYRWWMALILHVLGGTLPFLGALSSMLGWGALGGLVFWCTDESLKRHFRFGSVGVNQS